MPEVSSDLEMVRVTNEDFVKKAEACTPKLRETVVRPVSIVDIVKTDVGSKAEHQSALYHV